MNIESAARGLALHAHQGQTYPPSHDGKNKRVVPVPFEVHLGHVVGILHRFGWEVERELVAAAWLHDAIEDTPLTRREIEDKVSPDVGNLVWAVTDDPGDFPNRAARKAATYPKIAAHGPTAITLKLADRIANVESSILGSFDHFLDVYLREHPAFEAALRPHGGDMRMWEYLTGKIAAVHAARVARHSVLTSE
jgi:guanosine-3',5'-bis(diphosphate) 3'-pyrophosphohydrolase